MFHYKLIELESELAAKELSKQSFAELPVECIALLAHIEKEIGPRLSDTIPRDWQGWLSYRRNNNSLIVCRGRSFAEGSFAKQRAGLDVRHGRETIADYRRGFDVTPPQELDHLLLNFALTKEEMEIMLWYGENIAPYKLIFIREVSTEPYKELSEAIVEACIWILKRPKDQTLAQFLQQQAK